MGIKFTSCVVLGLLLVTASMGCSIRPPTQYVHSDYPYQHRFYGSYEQVMDAIKAVLWSQQWVITGQADPSVYDHTKKLTDASRQQAMIFAEQSNKIWGTRYKLRQMNIIVTEVSDVEVVVELRFVEFSRIIGKQIRDYNDDSLIKTIFQAE